MGFLSGTWLPTLPRLAAQQSQWQQAYPQLDLGSLSQPLLTGVSGAQSCGVQTSALLHTCTLVTHHLAKSEEGLGSTLSRVVLPPPQTVASQSLFLDSLLHRLDPASALGAVSLHTCLDNWKQRTVPLVALLWGQPLTFMPESCSYLVSICLFSAFPPILQVTFA